MPEMQKPGEKKTRTDILGGSLLLKLIILAGVGLIISVFLFGLPKDVFGWIWSFIVIFIGVFLIVLVIKGVQSYLTTPLYSPTEDFKTKLQRVAEACKPFNVHKLYLRGEDMRIYSFFGKIIGLLFIPYLSSVPEIDPKTKKVILVEKIDDFGEKVIDEKTKKVVLVQKMKTITEKDGEWLFLTKSGFWIFGDKKMVRASKDLCSDIGESVYIKDVNVVPMGDYLYPAKQWQADIVRIMKQHQSEAVIQTHEHFLDLVANTTQMSLASDPTFVKIMEAQATNLANQNAGWAMRQ